MIKREVIHGDDPSDPYLTRWTWWRLSLHIIHRAVAVTLRQLSCMSVRLRMEGHCGQPEFAEQWRQAIFQAQHIARECAANG